MQLCEFDADTCTSLEDCAVTFNVNGRAAGSRPLALGNLTSTLPSRTLQDLG